MYYLHKPNGPITSITSVELSLLKVVLTREENLKRHLPHTEREDVAMADVLAALLLKIETVVRSKEGGA